MAVDNQVRISELPSVTSVPTTAVFPFTDTTNSITYQVSLAILRRDIAGLPKISFGVAGSGATYECPSATPAATLQEAIDYLNSVGGGELVCLRGTYDMEDNVTTYSNILISGEGAATLFDGSGMTTGASENKYMFTSTSDAGKHDFGFMNFAVKGFFTAGTGSTYAVVPAVSGIRVSNARRVLIDNLYFQDTWNASTIGQNPDTNADDLGAGNIKQVIFVNNQCNNILGGLQGYSQDRIIWANNHFEDVGDDAIAFLGANNSDPASFKATIASNTFLNGRPVNTNGVSGVGVFLKLDGGGNGPDNIVDISVSGNTVSGAYIGFWYANASNIASYGNIVRDSYLSGFYESGGVSYSNTYGNRIINSNTSQNANHAGILHVNATDCMAEHNQISGVSSGFKQGIISQGTVTTVSYSYNQIKYTTGFAAIYCETFTGGRIDGNQITDGARGILYGGTNGTVSHNDLYGTFSISTIGDTGSTNVRSVNNSTGGNLTTENAITSTATSSFFDIIPGSLSHVRVRDEGGNLLVKFKSGAGSAIEAYKPGGTTYMQTWYTSTDSSAPKLRVDGSGNLQFFDAVNLIADTTTGTKIGTATTQKFGFYNATPIVQPSAYTQTYSTADKTHANFTSADIGAFTGGLVGFLDAAERDNVRTQVNALRADVADLKQLVNSLIDDLQALGLVG
jgi:hypothetical protein